MRPVPLTPVLVVLVASSIACSLVSDAVSLGGGPGGFKAEATSPLRVALTWDPVEGAQGYRLRVEVGELGFLPIATLGATATSYEDLMAPAESSLTYRIQVILASGDGPSRQTTVTTAAVRPNPLEVEARFDSPRATTGTIGVDGGSLSVDDRNGTQYQLDIPAGVLGNDTDFVLTPVSEIGGWPLDGDLLGAVRIEPEGVELYGLASLTISLPAGLAEDGLLPAGFAFDGTGREFHLEPTEVQSPSAGAHPSRGTRLASPALQPKMIVVVPLRRTGSHGAGRISGQRAADLSMGNPPTDAGARSLQQETVQKFLEEDLAPSAAEEELAPIPSKEGLLWHSLPLVFAQISSARDCWDMSNAMGAVSGWLEKAGRTPGVDAGQISRGHDLLLHDLAEKVAEITGKTAEKCRKTQGKSVPGSSCAADLIGRILHSPHPFLQDLQRQVMKDSGKDFLQQTKGDLKSCKAKSFRASGGSQMSWSGTICDIRQGFELTGTRPEGTLNFEFRPNSNAPELLAGGWTYDNPEAASAGCTESGFGTYTVILADGAGQADITGSASLSCPVGGGSFTVSDRITLTAIDRCSQ